MLLTPIARTRNGITSAMMRVTLTRRKEKRPTEEETERMTRRMLNEPSVDLDSRKTDQGRRGKRRGAFWESMEREEDVTLNRVYQPPHPSST